MTETYPYYEDPTHLPPLVLQRAQELAAAGATERNIVLLTGRHGVLEVTSQTPDDLLEHLDVMGELAHTDPHNYVRLTLGTTVDNDRRTPTVIIDHRQPRWGLQRIGVRTRLNPATGDIELDPTTTWHGAMPQQHAYRGVLAELNQPRHHPDAAIITDRIIETLQRVGADVDQHPIDATNPWPMPAPPTCKHPTACQPPQPAPNLGSDQANSFLDWSHSPDLAVPLRAERGYPQTSLDIIEVLGRLQDEAEAGDWVLEIGLRTHSGHALWLLPRGEADTNLVEPLRDIAFMIPDLDSITVAGTWHTHATTAEIAQALFEAGERPNEWAVVEANVHGQMVGYRANTEAISTDLGRNPVPNMLRQVLADYRPYIGDPVCDATPIRRAAIAVPETWGACLRLGTPQQPADTLPRPIPDSCSPAV